MDLSGSTSIGAQLLKAYLEYAEHGVDSMSRTIVETQGECESPFEEEVAAALIRYGLEPVPQVGCGGFRIDLALKHPAHPGLYCLGIECDGATYHSSKTARDRDRIRQSILENWDGESVGCGRLIGFAIRIFRYNVSCQYMNRWLQYRQTSLQLRPKSLKLILKIFSLSTWSTILQKRQPILKSKMFLRSKSSTRHRVSSRA